MVRSLAGKRFENAARAALACVFAACLAPAALAQSCAMYFTDFSAFSGPPNMAEGDLKVQWCLAGATVAASSSCNTGSALRLDSSSDDPMVLIATGAAGCTAIEIRFTYAQFAATQTTLKVGTTTATTANCSATTPTTLGVLTTTGTCQPVTATIQLNGAPGVYLRFDHGANANAIFIDDLEIRRVGCCTAGGHPCCTPGGPGCSDSTVAACVCAVDPFCCETQWDIQCVAEVSQFGCGTCSGGGACVTAFAADFGTLYSPGSVCSKFPALFESCEGTPPFLTSSLACASASDIAMRFSTGFPYSAAVTRCIDLTQAVAPALAFTYSKQSGTTGPKVDYSIDGVSWGNAWTAPVASDGSCTPVQLDLTPLAGLASVRFRFSSGSSVSNLAVFDDIAILEAPATDHPCCEVGAAGCDNAATSACTCAIDAYCCANEWDEVCIALATMYCGAACPDIPVCGSPTAGSCTAPHATPACADAECCVGVCTVDPFCCQSAWDEVCAEEAALGCFLPEDIDRDGRVSSVDLAMVLDQWGNAGGPADVDGNGVVGAGDLSAVLSAWTG